MKHRLTNLLLALVLTTVSLGLGYAGFQQAQPAAAQNTSTRYAEVTFGSAVVLTADATSTASTGWSWATLLGAKLSCTEDSGTATLDVAIQRSLDGGTTWDTIIAFTQLSATGAEVKLYADVRAASAQMIGDRLRANYDITGSGQYTCTLKGAAEA